jgi:hypothetical protein
VSPRYEAAEKCGSSRRYAALNLCAAAILKNSAAVIFLFIILWQKDSDSAIENHGVIFSMPAKIYRPAKTAMQSGKANTHLWVLEFDQEKPRVIDPVTAFTGSGDMRQQVRLSFETQELAEAYAKREGIEYRVIEPKDATRKNLSYTDNFRYTRTQPWTH